MKNLKKWLKFIFNSMSIYSVIASIAGVVILVNLGLNAEELGMSEKLQPLWVVFYALLGGNSAQMSRDIRRFRKQNRANKQAEDESL
jgi:hypothetical protein